MNNNEPIANPTWYGNIRTMFTQTDIDHMNTQGLDLTSYEAVKQNGTSIYGQVASGNMPPNAPWSQDQVATFLNWITNSYPKGTPTSQVRFLSKTNLESVATNATRIRKEISSLSPAEIDTLKAAFSGIMAKDVSDPNSYFVQAGYHWFPAGNLYCQHHVPGYNPWHRAYLVSFEDALRSIPGCEDVTLPYWDITTPFPEILKNAPFDAYTLPQAVSSNYGGGYVTNRYDYQQIQQNLMQYAVTDDLNRALTKTDWEDFHGFWSHATYNTIIAAHDGGHVSIGPTMADQGVAAFDPVFWFFHANWDRLFWQWQKQMQATELTGLLSTIDKQKDILSYQIFTVPALETLAPFSTSGLKLTTLSIIDSENSLGIDYEMPPSATDNMMLPKLQRSFLASEKFSVKEDLVNVRVQGLNRLKIPGSFSVHLLKDGQVIASKALFQPNEVEKCSNCVKNTVVHFDFELPLSEIAGGELGVWVEPVDKSFVGDHFPSKLMGNPTVDVHFLLQNK